MGIKTGFSAVVACLALVIGAVAIAQDATAPEVENSKYQFAGQVSGNDVYVRSGPGEGYYPTMKLDKGAAVTVVGLKFGWLKILPPEGSFSYIPKAWVERAGDGSIGRVTKPDLIVRAGSGLNEMKNAVQTSLNDNDRVVILGEKDEYFKIQPPAGAYLYVNKDFVSPVKQVAAVDPGAVANGGGAVENGGAANGGGANSGGAVANGDGANGATDTSATRGAGIVPENPGNGDAMAATQPGMADNAGAATQPATSQPVDAVAEAQDAFTKLEEQYKQVEGTPIDEQPVDEMVKGYEPLASGDKLPESMRRIAAYRLAILRERAKAKEQLIALKQEQEAFAKRQQASQAERSELTDRIEKTDVRIYEAVGELRPSSLQSGNEMLYRLTDPATGRTVVYVRSGDPNIGAHMGKFVGVKGSTATDSRLDIVVVTPTAVEDVDPAEVNTKVAAKRVPPSMASGK